MCSHGIIIWKEMIYDGLITSNNIPVILLTLNIHIFHIVFICSVDKNLDHIKNTKVKNQSHTVN